MSERGNVQMGSRVFTVFLKRIAKTMVRASDVPRARGLLFFCSKGLIQNKRIEPRNATDCAGYTLQLTAGQGEE